MPSDVPEREFASAEEREAYVVEIRTKVAQLRGAEGLTVAEIARQSGVKEGTLGPWMSDAYKGRQERVAYELERWLASRDVRRATLLQRRPRPGFQLTRTARDLIATFEHAQHTPDMVTVVGPPGIGKTEACRQYQRANPNVHVITGEPCATTPNHMIAEVARSVGITVMYAPQRASRAVIERLRNSGAILIMDEAQHWSALAIDQLRRWHDAAEIGIALVGNAAIARQIGGGARAADFAQLNSRVGVRVNRKAALRDDIEAMLDAWDVQDRTMRDELVAIAKRPGALRNLTKVMGMAGTMASGEGVELSSRHVALAWQQLDPSTVGAS